MVRPCQVLSLVHAFEVIPTRTKSLAFRTAESQVHRVRAMVDDRAPAYNQSRIPLLPLKC
jgi:hypothetical protein